MGTKNITIRMPKKKLAKWLRALRKGGYTQGYGLMYNERDYSFCCLGVLQHCLDNGNVECVGNYFATLPSLEWLEEQGIYFAPRRGGIAPSSCPYLPTLDMCAAAANDTGKSFGAIADAIEACSEGV